MDGTKPILTESAGGGAAEHVMVSELDMIYRGAEEPEAVLESVFKRCVSAHGKMAPSL